MGNVDEGITKPEIVKDFGRCTSTPNRTVKTVLPDSTAAAAVRQTAIISGEISGGIIRSDANSRGSVWSALS